MGIDYSKDMPDLSFEYMDKFYISGSKVPDPQIDPIIPGARVPIPKVGIAPVDVPIKLFRRDGGEQVLQAEVSIFCSVDSAEMKGLNLSRQYLTIHEAAEEVLSLTDLRTILEALAKKQGSKNAHLTLAFKYPWTQKSLRSRKDWKEGDPFEIVDGEKISLEHLEGHIAYPVVIEAEYREGVYKFFLKVNYTYSSTCPCSFHLAHHARTTRGVAANAHSQRSIAEVTVEFVPENIIWIEDIIELCRRQVPTEVQVTVKRIDEMAFAELNGANMLFSEDAVRLLYAGLDAWYDEGKILDFKVYTRHEESLHPWNAVAAIEKGLPDGLRV